MSNRNADRLKYKVTLPLIIMLSLASVYLFHTIIIKQQKYALLHDSLNELATTAFRIMNDRNGDSYDLNRLKTLGRELGEYNDAGTPAAILKENSTDLFPAVQDFISAAAEKDRSGMNTAARRMDISLSAVLLKMQKEFKAESSFMIKTEYAVLFLICICAALHLFIVDKPMYRQLRQTVREKEVCNSTIRKLAERDTLTNLPGRMKFHEDSEREVATCIRYGSDLALIKMDICNFKKINQDHGQKAGDRLLALFARTVRKHLRRPDSFFRVGGDKFIILAPHTDLENARRLTEKINRIVETDKSLHEIPFAINSGIAACGPEDSADSLLKKVDQALEQAKKYSPGSVYTQP